MKKYIENFRTGSRILFVFIILVGIIQFMYYITTRTHIENGIIDLCIIERKSAINIMIFGMISLTYLEIMCYCIIRAFK